MGSRQNPHLHSKPYQKPNPFQLPYLTPLSHFNQNKSAEGHHSLPSSQNEQQSAANPAPSVNQVPPVTSSVQGPSLTDLIWTLTPAVQPNQAQSTSYSLTPVVKSNTELPPIWISFSTKPPLATSDRPTEPTKETQPHSTPDARADKACQTSASVVPSVDGERSSPIHKRARLNNAQPFVTSLFDSSQQPSQSYQGQRDFGGFNRPPLWTIQIPDINCNSPTNRPRHVDATQHQVTNLRNRCFLTLNQPRSVGVQTVQPSTVASPNLGIQGFNRPPASTNGRPRCDERAPQIPTPPIDSSQIQRRDASSQTYNERDYFSATTLDPNVLPFPPISAFDEAELRQLAHQQPNQSRQRHQLNFTAAPPRRYPEPYPADIWPSTEPTPTTYADPRVNNLPPTLNALPVTNTPEPTPARPLTPGFELIRLLKIDSDIKTSSPINKDYVDPPVLTPEPSVTNTEICDSPPTLTPEVDVEEIEFAREQYYCRHALSQLSKDLVAYFRTEDSPTAPCLHPQNDEFNKALNLLAPPKYTNSSTQTGTGILPATNTKGASARSSISSTPSLEFYTEPTQDLNVEEINRVHCDSTSTNSDGLEKRISMYPVTMDQSRQENVPAQHTLQVHMHHLCCPCSNVIYPYYPPGYRPPLLAQPPPIPRPSYLHHYQYTQLHVNPAYNVPLPPPITQHLPQSMNPSPPSTVDLAFGPPPRDRRNLEGQDYDEQRQMSDKNKSENRNSLLQYAPLPLDNSYGAVNFPDNLQEAFRNLTAAQVAALSTENYIKYLDNGCFIGETIAKRNEQRPCFKNIQNLCNRTRSEVMKPNITVSNIHSQGVPWATKDFIFAFVRAINCWCILRGYLGCKDGNLGKIDREISPEFRACYAKWEKCTKQLTHYLIQTFHKLDEANSSPNLSTNNSQSHSNPGPSTSASSATLVPRARNPSPPQETPRKVVQVLTEPTPQTVERKLSNKEMAALKGVPGILHIPPASSAELGEARNPNSESTEISPRDEESDSESRVYMKPGSYNVPTKQQSSQSTTNSPRSIEFLDTAQNVSGHHRKIASEKPEPYSSETLRDKAWQTAQNVTPNFIKQQNEGSSSGGGHLKHIESWLNNERNIFDCVVPDAEEENVQQPEDMLQPSAPGKSGKANESRCNSMASNDMESAPRTYRNRPAPRGYSSFRRNFAAMLEYKTGGLTDTALALLDRILKELERTDFAQHINLKIPYARSDEAELKNPTDLSTIAKKLENKMHVCLNEVVHDFRHIICCSSEFFTDGTILKQLATFRDKFEDMISHAFPNVDFNHITGEPNETLGPIVGKRGRPRKVAEGDGDH